MSDRRPDRVGVLMVCLGNICRSPMAEGLMLEGIRRRGVADRFDVDSAGTGGWHAGEPADPRMQATARARGVHLPSRARQIRPEDWTRFDHVLCMDRSNLAGVRAAGCPESRSRLMLSVLEDPAAVEVPDPYHGGPEGFELVFDLLERATDAWLDRWLA
ncbi:MAG: low molecular weight protein-tyrosine-phosphatase [Planctomycetota bacterium]